MVKSGRHPLQEQCVETFVSNDIGMLDSDEEIQPGKVIIMTGPNACGKSVYLKQVCTISTYFKLDFFILNIFDPIVFSAKY